VARDDWASADWRGFRDPKPTGDHPPAQFIIPDFFKAFSPHALGQLKLWLEEFEKRGSTGDYVFLQEKVVTTTGDPILFSSIPQGYRHLVVEVLGANTGSSAEENALAVYLNGNGPGSNAFGYSGYYVWDSTDGRITDAAVGTNYAIYIEYVIPSADGRPAGKYGSVMLRFPYYSVAGINKNVMWQSAGEDYVSPNAEVLATFGAGVGGNEVSAISTAITSIELTGDDYDWKAGSRASLYGIR